MDLAPDTDFARLLDHGPPQAAPPQAGLESAPMEAIAVLARHLVDEPALAAQGLRRAIEAIAGRIDLALGRQIDLVLHHPEFQALEASWRGLSLLVRGADRAAGVKVRVLDIAKRELGRTLRKFRGNAWDHSPIFLRIYEEEFGQLGGEPYGVLVGDYAFDHRPDDVALLGDIAMIAAAAHAPFIAAAAPALLQMESWDEVANPRDLPRLFTTPDYVAWRALREQADARFIGLCMPRFLARLPYGAATDPLESFAFEEQTEGPDTSRLLWANPAWAFAANAARAFAEYGWCARIRGIDRGGVVAGLPVLHHPGADGNVDRRTVTEICISERREAELAGCGLMALVHRKNSDVAAFISAQSLQKPPLFEDEDATANANLSARLPYLFASCRFAHYLKAMVRAKVGTTMPRAQLEQWLNDWLRSYVDTAPELSTEEFRASHPLVDGRVALAEVPERPGQYEARIYIKPHFQMEGLSVALRLSSHVAQGA